MKYNIRIEVCKECHGTGFIKGIDCRCNECEIKNTCKDCNGKGKIKIIDVEENKGYDKPSKKN